MNMKRDEIINGIRKEGMNVGKDGFPIDILPQKLQFVVLTFQRYENYVADFLVTALFSAASAAMGNSFRLRIKGLWTANPALYVVLFGKPGLGKTPPMEAAYRPLRKRDEERLIQYLKEKSHYEMAPKEEKSSLEKPVLQQTVVSDFTVEALMQTHYDNPDGVAAVCDEIIGLVYSADRYNKSLLNEVLLTAFSGGTLNVIRRSIDTPILIKQPCINIIGTTQPALLKQLRDKWANNGFLDRVVFVHPKNSTIAPWVEEDETTLQQSAKAQKDLDTVINGIFELKKNVKQVELHFTPEAKSHFFVWQNSIISAVNAITDETLVDTREMKRCLITAKLALIIQVLRHVCGEAGKDAVDLESVKAAIAANEYYEESYDYFKTIVGQSNTDSTAKEKFLSMCEGEFATADAIWAGKQYGINERTVKRWLKEYTEKGIFYKLEHGRYKRNQ